MGVVLVVLAVLLAPPHYTLADKKHHNLDMGVSLGALNLRIKKTFGEA